MAVQSVVVEAVTAARLRLAELTDQPAMADELLVALLQRARRGEDVDALLVDALQVHPRLRGWVVRFVETWPPPGTKGAPGWGGRAAPVAAPRFVCPVDGLVSWYRRSIGDPIPRCPDHPDDSLVPDADWP